MRAIIFIVLMYAVYWLCGLSVSRWLRVNANAHAFAAIGFIAQIALIQALGWWMVAFRQSAILFTVLVCGVVAFLLGSGVFFFFKDDWKLKKVLGTFSLQRVLLLCVAALVIVNLVVYQRSDADDSFYVSNVCLFSYADRLNPYDSTTGNALLGTLPLYDFQIWEAYLSVLVRLTGISASVMCHFVMAIVLVGVATSAYFALGNSLLRDDRKNALFCATLLLFYLFGGYAPYSKGSFLLSRLWQGKAVYLHVALPIIIALILNEREKQPSARYALLLLFVMLGGAALNPTSLYIMGLEMGLLILCVSFTERQWKKLLPILPASGMVIFFALMIYFRTRVNTGQLEELSAIDENFLTNVLASFMGSGRWFFYAYIPVSVYFLIQGNRQERILLVFCPLLFALIVLNPRIAPLLASKANIAPTFWRFLWLLPVDFAFALMAVRLCDGVEAVLKDLRKGESRGAKARWISTVAVFAGFACFFALSGTYMFSSQNGFAKAANMERIQPEYLLLGDEIMSRDAAPVVLSEDYGATVLRQQYPALELICSRPQYIVDLYQFREKPMEAEQRLALRNFANAAADPAYDLNSIQLLLRMYKVGWVLARALPEESVGVLERSGFKQIREINGCVLYGK